MLLGGASIESWKSDVSSAVAVLTTLVVVVLLRLIYVPESPYVTNQLYRYKALPLLSECTASMEHSTKYTGLCRLCLFSAVDEYRHSDVAGEFRAMRTSQHASVHGIPEYQPRSSITLAANHSLSSAHLNI